MALPFTLGPLLRGSPLPGGPPLGRRALAVGLLADAGGLLLTCRALGLPPLTPGAARLRDAPQEAGLDLLPLLVCVGLPGLLRLGLPAFLPLRRLLDLDAPLG